MAQVESTFYSKVKRFVPFVAPSIVVVALMAALVCAFLGMRSRALGIVIYGVALLVIWLLRPGSLAHRLEFDDDGRACRVARIVTVGLTVIVAVAPMSLAPIWNGEVPDHRNQYELLADAFAHGRLSLYEGEDTSGLEALDNPYDPAQREGVAFHFDHAYYEGKYYVYFGAVPAVFVFLPYQLLFGHSLTTYHATQLFTALFIIGLFCLFYTCLKAFKLRLSLSVYLALCSFSSLACVLLAMECPALYCTAITAGLCFEVWSLYFFMNGVYLLEGDSRQLPYVILGGLCGALVFGCRPPIGLMNLLCIPMLAHYLRNNPWSTQVALRVALVISAYVVVFGLLFLYNYLRFGSPFEFGASYQLTAIDVAAYAKSADARSFPHLLHQLREYFLAIPGEAKAFPFVGWGGVVCNYPVLLYVLTLLHPAALREARDRKLMGFICVALLLPILMAVFDSLWSPHVSERYRMDLYPVLMLLLLFAVSLTYVSNPDQRGIFSFITCLLVLAMMAKCTLLFFAPYDGNWTDCYPEMLERVARVLMPLAT